MTIPAILQHADDPRFRTPKMCVDRRQVMARWLDDVATLPGDVVDIGCGNGRTSSWLQFCLDEMGLDKGLHLYDAFPVAEIPVGAEAPPVDFAAECDHEAAIAAMLPVIGDKPTIHPGWVEDTLPIALPTEICFAHIDLDNYTSTTHSLQSLWDRLVPGAAVLIDDYGNGYLPGVRQAVEVFVGRRRITIQVTVGGLQGGFRVPRPAMVRATQDAVRNETPPEDRLGVTTAPVPPADADPPCCD